MIAAQPTPAFAASASAAPQANPIENIGAFDPRRAGGRQGRDAAAEPTGTAVASPRDILLFHLQAATLATGTGSALRSQVSAMGVAAYSGMPVARVGRGDPEGPIPTNPNDLTIEGNNLDAIKARVLLRASMLKLGRLPKARDPRNPTPKEREAALAKIAEYQAIFDTH